MPTLAIPLSQGSLYMPSPPSSTDKPVLETDDEHSDGSLSDLHRPGSASTAAASNGTPTPTSNPAATTPTTTTTDQPSGADLLPARPPKRRPSGSGAGPARAVKRRASKACQCCRQRKVRCNVTEHGAPCTNCRLDEVECVVNESRRKKKWGRLLEKDDSPTRPVPMPISAPTVAPTVAPTSLLTAAPTGQAEFGLPYPAQPADTTSPASGAAGAAAFEPVPLASAAEPALAEPGSLPPYIRPLPARIGPDEIGYLSKKGSLTVPPTPLRNELIRACIDFVQPYMPVLDVAEFARIVDAESARVGQLSLILFQAVMFAGSAFVDMDLLSAAGYGSRKEARKAFFQRARLLYDFDYESDRLVLVQALLLLTYYYETPDDQKDTWHWMGVATSIAHTIGLHRSPDRGQLGPGQVRLRRRIWWSAYLRDRMIAIGMRRPARIKSEDHDVPMLALSDFDLTPLPESVRCVPATSVTARSERALRTLAILSIEMMKLSVCISAVLSKQYCVLNNNLGLLSDRTTMMLLPKKLDPDATEVKMLDEMLQQWFESLPSDARYTSIGSGNASVDLCRGLLHMVYYTTVSALHRPQVLPTAPAPARGEGPPASSLDNSRRSVRRAAAAITAIAQTLDARGLVRYLPTSGVTVLLPAIIIHLLDIKAPDAETRQRSLCGFFQCMHVMGKLRDVYAAADYSTAFLEAAIRKAGVNIGSGQAPERERERERVEALGEEKVVRAGGSPFRPAQPAAAARTHRYVQSVPNVSVSVSMAAAAAEVAGRGPSSATASAAHDVWTTPPGTLMNPAATLHEPASVSASVGSAIPLGCGPDEAAMFLQGGPIGLGGPVGMMIGQHHVHQPQQQQQQPPLQLQFQHQHQLGGQAAPTAADIAALDLSFSPDETLARSGQGLMLWGAAAAAGEVPKGEEDGFEALLMQEALAETGVGWDEDWMEGLIAME